MFTFVSDNYYFTLTVTVGALNSVSKDAHISRAGLEGDFSPELENDNVNR